MVKIMTNMSKMTIMTVMTMEKMMTLITKITQLTTLKFIVLPPALHLIINRAKTQQYFFLKLTS